jgi:hypothetical protein
MAAITGGASKQVTNHIASSATSALPDERANADTANAMATQRPQYTRYNVANADMRTIRSASFGSA